MIIRTIKISINNIDIFRKHMQNSSIPIMGYVFIGATTMALALVTVLDKSGAQADNKSSVSSTSMLPNIFNTTGPSTSISSQPIKVGGKKRKTRRRK